MKTTIFHGSDHVIRKPVFHGGRRNNDYGYGFYCTETLELAKEWAVTPLHDGYANQYELDTEELSILDLNREYGVLEWLALLINNRRFNLDSPVARELQRIFEGIS